MNSDIIQLLPDHVANQIAAGEVVQRPSSVVKELLENAVDAQATRITLLVKDAGKTLIQVVDNGTGMSGTDARLSFERHATSKISTADDLFRLHTKGFRGEALASIAAIAHVALKTRKVDDELGTEILIKGSEVLSQQPCVTSKGTLIEVKNLFYNVPARRNFLKSDSVELKHIIDEFHRVALAHPQIAFVFYHNDNELFELPVSNIRQRIVAVFGRKTNERLVPVSEETEVVRISGFVGKPQFAKRTKGEQFFFVNQRFVKSGYLHHAVKLAYEGLLQDKQQPSYFLFLEINPESIDINIHPTKTEVKFDDEYAIYAILRSAVKHSLGQFNVAPTLDFKRDSALDTPYYYKDKAPEVPKIEVDRNFNPFTDEKQPGHRSSFPGKSKNPEWESLYTGLDTASAQSFSSVELESDAVSGRLFDDSQEEKQQGIFQLQNKYIVSALKESVLVIHQFRAHYRILFEEFLKNITARPAVSQQLLFPLSLNMSTQHVTLLGQVRELLEQTGFDFSQMSGQEVTVRGIPGVISESEVAPVLDKIIADLEQGIPEDEFGQTKNIAENMARASAIKVGRHLSVEEQLNIINRLFACTEPNYSPDNKNIFIRLNVEEIDKNFN